MRIASAITLSAEERTRLESQARSRFLTVRVAERFRIVLLAASGQPDKEIAASMAITPKKFPAGASVSWRWAWPGCRKTRTGRDASPPSVPPDQTRGDHYHAPATQQRKSLERSYHGCGGRHQPSQSAAHLARPWIETASRGSVPDPQ
jgi:hypothetical protein